MKRIILIALFLGMGVSYAYAQGLSTLSDTVTRHAPSIASNHQMIFTSAGGLGESGNTLTVAFDGNFDLSTITVSDIDFSYGVTTGFENPLVLAATPSLTDWGVVIGVSSFVFTHPTDSSVGDIPANSKIGIKIGTNAGGVNQIINPPLVGSEIIRISTNTGEYGALAIPISQDQVGVGATTGASDLTATIQWAVPELRVGSAETNDDTDFYISVLTAVDNDNVVLFTQPAIASLTTSGVYLTPIPLTSVFAGTYDVAIKTSQHLSKKLDNISLVSGNNVLNFSSPTNAAGKDVGVLLAGDINDTGVTPSTLGDDVVNSVDLSVMLNVLDDDDVTGNDVRANVNQDIVINSVDLSILIKNLDLEGEK